jgi:hypothetical protein
MTLTGPCLRVGRAARAAALLAASILVPAAAGAQGQGFFRVSGSFEELYDDNLFATPVTGTPQSSLISRFGPEIETGYRSIPLVFIARYGFDAERHVDLPELDEVFARQEAAVDLTRRGRRLVLTAAASYRDTHTPQELNTESLLVIGRAYAQRLTVQPGLAYQITPLTTLRVDHDFSRDGLEGGVSSTTNVPRAGIERQLDPRNRVRIDYRFRHFAFGNGGEELSHVLTAGWLFAVTPSTSFEIDAGPRRTVGATRVDPELSVALKHTLRQGEISLSYVRTMDTAIGEPGALDVQRLGTIVSFAPTRYFTLTATPAWVSTTRDVRRTVVHALDLEGRVRATRRWTLLVSGRIGGQEGVAPGRSDVVQYRSLSLKSIVTLGSVERDGSDGTR